MTHVLADHVDLLDVLLHPWLCSLGAGDAARMTDTGHAVELLLALEPDASGLERIITELQQVPMSGFLKRKVFGEWATTVGASPTAYDFERVARIVTPPRAPGVTP